MPRPSNFGYTLIEAMIALVILLVGLVPLSAFFAYQLKDNMARDKLTAICIMEQTVCRVRCAPMAVASEITMNRNHRDWKVDVALTGTDLQTADIKVQTCGKVLSEAVFYVYDGKTK